jgi:hypothetical protein
MEARDCFFIKRVMQYELGSKARREAFHSTIDVLEMRMRKIRAKTTGQQDESDRAGDHVQDSDEKDDSEFDYDQAGYRFDEDDE